MHQLFRSSAIALIAGLATEASAAFVFQETDNNLTLLENDAPVLVFNHREVPSPTGGPSRSGYLHPLFGLDGETLTDDYPADHPHHRGVFFGWPFMLVKGKKVDFWHLRGLRPSFEDLKILRAGEETAAFESRNIWRLSDRSEAIREHLRYTVHSADAVGRVIDIHAIFTNLTNEPITLRGSEKSAYGGLNVRVDGSRPDSQVVSAQGRVPKDANFIDPPSPWADHSSRAGPDQPHSGVAIFQHPSNPNFPGRYWTLRLYGFLGAAWPGEKTHTIAPAESLELRYRLFVHRGTADEAGVAERFDQYERQQQPATGG